MLFIGIGGWRWFVAPFFVWMFVWFLVGAISPLSAVTYTTLIHSETPQEMTGRIIAVTHGLQNSALLISPLLGVIIAKWIGIGGVFFLAGVCFILFSAMTPWLVKRYKLEPKKYEGELAS
ncbi:hypothetical protein [Salinithrix halophila]|uniref:Major facilitator superfamily (MFS) profile domain-containing protein n=1 Tax=Salinithrix halophila TaxID=1485204 RepID=A0ABV8JH08_9BACL